MWPARILSSSWQAPRISCGASDSIRRRVRLRRATLRPRGVPPFGSFPAPVMPIDPEFIQILRSPDTRKPLRCADESELEQINQLIDSGSAVNRAWASSPWKKTTSDAMNPSFAQIRQST